MTTNLTIKSHPGSITETSRFDVKTVRTRLNHTMCEKINAINALHQQNMNGYKSDVQLLNRGVFYPPEYYFALKQKNQTKRIEALFKKEFFFKGYLSSNHFNRIEGDNFSVKKGVLPSDALKYIFEGLCLMGCGQVVQAVQYAAIQEVLGADKFNALFSPDGPAPLVICIEDESISPLSKLRVLINKKNPQPAEIKNGDSVYFENHEDYDAKHLGGTTPGHHTICIDDNGKEFAAFGLPPGGLNSEEIKEDLLKEFNSEPESIEYLPERIRNGFEMIIQRAPHQFRSLKNKVCTMKEFEAKSGGRATLLHRLDVNKIILLANSSLENSCGLFSRWTA